VFDQLHPKIYGAAVGLVGWFALMAWVLFDHGGQTSLALTFMTVLFIVAVLLPWTLSQVWKRFQMPYEHPARETSLHDWRNGDFVVWGCETSRHTCRHRRAAAADRGFLRPDRDRDRLRHREGFAT
jgi:hypothetical protein